MSHRDRNIRAVQILLTLTALECFGPIIRDFNVSHAWNPDWAPHARYHLVWQLGTMGLSGIANLYLIWFRKPWDVRNLWLSAAWQGTILAGFWIAYLLTPVYEGSVTMPDMHVDLLGINENVVVFTVLLMMLGSVFGVLATRLREGSSR